jgi:hypothetical protein
MADETSIGTPTLAARVAARARMTEGQLYTLAICSVALLLLIATALPNAGERTVERPAATPSSTVQVPPSTTAVAP